MSMLQKDEYLEIKEFLRHRVCEITRSENIDREEQRKENTKVTFCVLSDTNSLIFGVMSHVNLTKY